MTLPTAIALVLALAVLLAGLRMAWQWRRAPDGVRPRTWRAGFLLVAQATSAGLLWFALFPPALPLSAETLVVLTANAGKADAGDASGFAQGRMVALPEATGLPLSMRGAERMPDLATALRRHPAVTRLHVVGAGLTARDRAAASALPVQFTPAPLPRGLLGLQPPVDVSAGRSFSVAGRTDGLERGSAELLDPAGRRVARTDLDDEGSFVLGGTVRDAGRARFRVRLRDSGNRVVETVDLPIDVQPAPALRALVLAGAPNPELKFLRRWAEDAGIEMEARIDLGGGLQVGDAPATLTAATLDRLDVLVVDERRWRALGGTQRATVLSAVERGLGLLLRVSALADDGDRRSLQALGFAASAAPRRDTRLGAGFVRPGDAADALPTLTRSPVAVGGTDAVPALTDAAGNPLAAWRTRGRGRIGVAAFDDSYRMALAGRRDAHGEAWSRLFSAVARGQELPARPTIRPAAPNERSTICGVADGMRVRAPDGNDTVLLVDPATGPARCAGFWARQAGEHVLHPPAATQTDDGSDIRFQVPTRDALPAMQAQALREATHALATTSAPTGDRSRATTEGPRWPWFLGWLLLTGTMWWLERSRRGLRAVATTDEITVA